MTTATKPANTNRNPYAVAYGAKYRRDLDVTDVAKLVRADGCVKCGPVCLLPDPVGDDVSVQEAWS